QLNLAALTSATVGVGPEQQAHSLALSPTVPSPVRARARIRFTLPSDDLVTLKVYDLAGRQVASLLDRKAVSAGVHDVEVDTRDWRPGCYFYRLVTRGGSRTQRTVVLR